jgi:hypothetical protein
MFGIRVALPPLCLYTMEDLYISFVSVTDVTVNDHEDSLVLVHIRPGAYSMHVIFVLHPYSVLVSYDLTRLYFSIGT